METPMEKQVFGSLIPPSTVFLLPDFGGIFIEKLLEKSSVIIKNF